MTEKNIKMNSLKYLRVTKCAMPHFMPTAIVPW